MVLKKIFPLFLVSFMVLMFSLEIVPEFSIYNQIPDIVLIFLVFISLRRGPLVGILAGFFLGLFIDFFSGQLLGSQAFIKMSIGFIAGIIGSKLIVFNLQTEILSIFILNIVQIILFYFILLIFSTISSKVYFSGVWIHLFYTAFIAPVFIFGFKFFDSKKTERF